MNQQAGIIESEVGKRIKSLRLEKQVTLERLALQTGFTKSYLAKIEKSEKAPPVSTLCKIALFFGVTISYLLGEGSPNATICLVTNRERSQSRRDVPDSGYYYESIAQKFVNKLMEPFVITFPFKQKKQGVFQHVGEEFLFVLEGKMKFTYGNDIYLLEEGDSLYFDSGVPHLVASLGPGDAKCLSVFTTPSVNRG